MFKTWTVARPAANATDAHAFEDKVVGPSIAPRMKKGHHVPVRGSIPVSTDTAKALFPSLHT